MRENFINFIFIKYFRNNRLLSFQTYSRFDASVQSNIHITLMSFHTEINLLYFVRTYCSNFSTEIEFQIGFIFVISVEFKENANEI